MPNPIKVLSGLNKAMEEFGYALGEAQDFIDREEPNLCELIDAVAFGQLSSSEAKRKVHDIFAKARVDVGEWKGLRADIGSDGGFAYLHPSLNVGRIVTLLPDHGKPEEARPLEALTLFGPAGESA